MRLPFLSILFVLSLFFGQCMVSYAMPSSEISDDGSSDDELGPESGIDKPLPLTTLPLDSQKDVLARGSSDPAQLSDDLESDSDDTSKKSTTRESKRERNEKTESRGASRTDHKNSEDIGSRSNSENKYSQRRKDSGNNRELTLEEVDSRARVNELKPEVTSLLETAFSGRFSEKISRNLKQFGYDLFNRAQESFTPLEDIPVSSDYLIGPGDTFILNVWGATNFTKKITVRRDGTIFVPKVGTLKVVGLSYQKMNSEIEGRITRLFSGVRVSISFESIRSVQVMIVGEVERPGSYEVASTSSPINALFYSGGIKKTGSLRQIKVIRANKEIATVDLYDFLIHGSNLSVKLQSQDVILVPLIGKVAAVAGNVKRPAIYEILPQTSIYDLLVMSGGLSFSGHAGRLSLERVVSNKERTSKDLAIPQNFSSMDRKEAVQSPLGETIQDGDFVRVFPVLKEMTQTVFLRGHVKRPGLYEFKAGLHVKDLIPSLDSLKPEPYTQFAQIIRTMPPKDEKKSIFIHLEKAIEADPENNIELQDRDQVVVFSKDQLNLRETVSISGKVNKPGDYFYFEGMRLRDLIFMAGNLTQDAYLANAEVARYPIINNELKFERFQVNLQFLSNNNDDANNPSLKPKDNVLIQGIPSFNLNNYIELAGEVKFPGRYSYSHNEKLSSVLKRAGGFTDKAFLSGALFTRETVKAIQQKNLKEQTRQLEQAILQESIRPSEPLSPQDMQGFQEAVSARKALLKNLEQSEVSGRMVLQLENLKDFENGRFDITLEPGDTLTVPPIPSVVTILGEVYNPTSVVFVSDKSVQYYLDQTGGPTINADTESIFVIRSDGSVVSKRQNRGFLLRGFSQMEIERGDTILVPKDITRFSWLNTTKDITEILFKIASTTGITITAFR